MTVSVGSYRELFALVAARPRMYLMRDDFPTTVAYVEGCDQGNARSLLAGFREWLITQAGCGDNLVWWALVLKLALPEWPDTPASLSTEQDMAAKQTLYRLLDEFLELRDERDGLTRIYTGYQQWRAARTTNGRTASEQTARLMLDPHAPQSEPLGVDRSPPPDGEVSRRRMQVGGWVTDEHVVKLLRHISAYIGYAYDDLDEAALTGMLDGTNDEAADGWFEYPLAGMPTLVVRLARSPGSAVVSVRVEGTMDPILAARIETLLDLL